MPRMPSADSLGFNLPQSRAIPRQQQDVVGEGLARAGGAVANLGQAVSDTNQRNIAADRDIALREKEQADALDLARARADWNKRRLEEEDQYRLEKNPNYAGWEKTFSANIEKHRTASISMIRSPRLRERFDAETRDDVTHGAITIRNRAAGIDKDLRVTQAVQGLDDSISLAAKPGTDPKAANAILAQARANIDNLQATGVIDPAKALELRRGLAQKYAKAKIGQDIQDDPMAAAAWLDGSGGQGTSGLIRKQEGYRSRPYRDSDGAWRVGFGSDTVTMEDGTVVKVQPGMNITRADAERDLKRRIGEFEAGAIHDVGPHAWASLPSSAKSALIDVAYNYGSLPQSVVNAIRSGDLGQISSSVRDLARHNKGINARRRNEEADIILSGSDNISELNPPDYYSVLDVNDRQALQSDAESEIAAREKANKEATALQAYQTRSAMEDDLSQIKETGQPTNLDPQTVVNVLGEDDAAKWLEKRKTAADTYAAVSVMDSMTNAEIEEHLTTLEPKAGAEDFSSKQEVYDAAEKRANKLLDLRVKDPAKSIEDNPAVVEAKKAYDPSKPETIQPVIRARLAAQGAVGIPEASQQPVTNKEAYAIIAPMQTILDQADAKTMIAMSKAKTPEEKVAIRKATRAATEQAVRDIINQVDEIYGPYSQQVLAAAVAASVRDKQIGEITASIIRKTAQGEKVPIVESQALQDATEAAASEKAMDGQLPPAATTPEAGAAAPAQPQPPARPGGVPPTRSGTASVPVKHRPPPGGWPYVDEASVQALINNPALAPQFDARFGDGEAAKWLPKPPPKE